MGIQANFDRIEAVEKGIVIEEEDEDGFKSIVVPNTHICMADYGDQHTICVDAKKQEIRHTLCDLLVEHGIPVTFA